MEPKNSPQYNPTRAEYCYQPQHYQQEGWQQERQLQQQYQMNQQNLQQRWQGRGTFQNQGMDTGGGNMYAGDTVYSHKYLSPPPAPRENFGGISEEIRIQANLQHRQQQQDESGLAYDPYLICHKCNRQFREGQLPEYRHHIDNCRQ